MNNYMKRGTTNFLRVVIFIMGLAVLALCISIILVLDRAGEYRLVLVGMCASAIPFFIALYETLKLLNYIDRNLAFSNLSVAALINIKKCAIIISTLYTACMPLIIFAADRDDAPGAVLIGLVIIFASMVVAVFSSVLQKLLISAIEIKSENELTV